MMLAGDITIDINKVNNVNLNMRKGVSQKQNLDI